MEAWESTLIGAVYIFGGDGIAGSEAEFILPEPGQWYWLSEYHGRTHSR